MNNKIIGAVVVMAIAAVTAFNLSINAENNELSALLLDNVEALASSESGSGMKCWNTVTSKEGSQVLYCGSCTWISGTYSWNSGSGTC